MQPITSPPTIPSSHSTPSTISHDIHTSLDSTSDFVTATTTHDAPFAPSPLIQPTNSPHTLGTQPHASTPNHSMVTRSKTGSLKPKTFADYQLHHITQSEKEPVSYSKRSEEHTSELQSLV